MVLQQTHSGSRAQQPRLDFNRILGISGTLALNVLAMMLLLVPTSLPDVPPLADRDPELTWILPKPPVTPPPPPERVEVVRPRTPVQPVRERPVAPPVVEQQVIVDAGTLAADPPVDTMPAQVDAMPTVEPPTPATGMRLEYASAPAPAYPREAIQRQLEGTVLLQVLVDVDGKPLEVSIHRSSGHSVLDREARRHVLRSWTFRPAMKDGRPVQAIGVVPIDFTLGRM